MAKNEPRVMICFLRLSLRFLQKYLTFAGKYEISCPKLVCLFPVFFM